MGTIIREFTGGNILRHSTGRVLEYIPLPDGSGGVVSYDGLYKIHTFTTDGVFTIDRTTDVSVLIVGGGAQGRGRGTSGTATAAAGYGGGGGFVRETTLNISAGQYDISIGKGGYFSEADHSGTSGIYHQRGFPTYAFGLDSSGAPGHTATGSSSTTGTLGSSASGYARGNAYSGTGFFYAGGGGGHTAAGTDAIPGSGFGGTGGTGYSSNITGVSLEYARGGNGGTHEDAGGGYDPSTNIGEGGRGTGGIFTARRIGFKGSDGVVIIRYKYRYY